MPYLTADEPAPPLPDEIPRGALQATGRPPSEQLPLAVDLGRRLPDPGTGGTARRWDVLASLGALDLQLARVAEPHLDAVSVLAEARRAGHPVPDLPDATWGVWAAEGPGHRLHAREHRGRWTLSGSKPWCSLAGTVSHALVTAWVDERRRRLFAVDLDEPGVRPGEPEQWVARGLRDVVSLPVELVRAPATPVGPPEWYVERDGFAWGGMGVAAVWWGGAVGLARRLARPTPREQDQVGHLHLGRVDVRLSTSRSLLCEAARRVDAGRARGAAGNALALRVRGAVAESVEAVLQDVEHALGPGPAVSEGQHAARLADLRVYLRQHHGERDLAALGRSLSEAGVWW
jgi:alkylation response protein AidB-like acyl-CoA dehydrogenase